MEPETDVICTGKYVTSSGGKYLINEDLSVVMSYQDNSEDCTITPSGGPRFTLSCVNGAGTVEGFWSGDCSSMDVGGLDHKKVD